MKANKGQIERALDAPPSDIRLFLLYGPDEAGSRALAERLDRAMGSDAERIDLDSATLKSDPALLSDEAASISLFGGARHIRLIISGSGDDAMPAITALITAQRAGNPVVAIATSLKSTNSLLKFALGNSAILAFPSYIPEGQDAERIVNILLREAGLRLSSPDITRRLIQSTGGDRALLGQEIEKLALYLDAAPDRPAELDNAAIDALGADSDEGDTSRLVNAVMSGNPKGISYEMSRLSMIGIEGIPLVRAMFKRVLMLSQLRAELDQGQSIDAVLAAQGKAIFWKEKPAIQRQLGRWTAPLLATALTRLLRAERALKASGNMGSIIAENEFIALCKVAARNR